MREKVPGIGPKTEGLLKKLRIETIDDLITTYPRYYTEYPDIVSIGEAKEGEACAVEGWSANTPISNGKVAKIIVMNGAESISVSWFHVPPLAKTIKSGVNYLDTAYIYPGSEVAVGEILHRNHCREEIRLATKLPQYYIKSGVAIEKYFNEQLTRLQTDYIDYYLMHMLTDIAAWEKLKKLGIEDWITQKKKEGKIPDSGCL